MRCIPSSQSRDTQKVDSLVLPMILMYSNRCNADAMVLASALMRGIHPPENIQNGGRPEE